MMGLRLCHRRLEGLPINMFVEYNIRIEFITSIGRMTMNHFSNEMLSINANFLRETGQKRRPVINNSSLWGHRSIKK